MEYHKQGRLKKLGFGRERMGNGRTFTSIAQSQHPLTNRHTKLLEIFFQLYDRVCVWTSVSIISVFPMAKNHQNAWLYQAINWGYKIEHNTDLGVMSLVSDAQYWTCFKIFLTKFFNQFLMIGHQFPIIFMHSNHLVIFLPPFSNSLLFLMISRNWNVTKLDLASITVCKCWPRFWSWVSSFYLQSSWTKGQNILTHS